MVTTRTHSPQHWSGRKQQGIAQPLPRVGVRWSAVCLHSSQSPAFTGFAGRELTLYKREGVWLYGLGGRVSGYWNPRRGVWLFGGRGRVSGYLELAPFTPLFQLSHCRHIQPMFIPEKGPFVNRKCWGAWGVRNLLCCRKEKHKTATWKRYCRFHCHRPGPCGQLPHLLWRHSPHHTQGWMEFTESMWLTEARAPDSVIQKSRTELRCHSHLDCLGPSPVSVIWG